MVFRGLIAVVFVILVVQLWRLQMVRGDYYRQAADINRFRLEPNPAPRGVIYDRRGHLLARNMPQITVSVIPAYLPEDEMERRALLFDLAELIEVPMTRLPPVRLPRDRVQPALEPEPEPEPGILEILQAAELAPYRPAVLKRGVPREVAMILEEEHLDWPGVLVQVEPVREYLYGSSTGACVGLCGTHPRGASGGL